MVIQWPEANLQIFCKGKLMGNILENIKFCNNLPIISFSFLLLNFLLWKHPFTIYLMKVLFLFLLLNQFQRVFFSSISFMWYRIVFILLISKSKFLVRDHKQNKVSSLKVNILLKNRLSLQPFPSKTSFKTYFYLAKANME